MTSDIQAGGPPANNAFQSALTFLNADQPDNAVECYQHLLKQNPTNEEAW